MARIDIEIEDYLDEVATKYLFNELEKRHDFKDIIKTYIEKQPVIYKIPDFKTSNEVLKFIKDVLKLKQWCTKDQIINEINKL